MLEKCLIQHCSPTLAGIKAANLFMYEYTNEDSLLMEIKECNTGLFKKGIVVSVMNKKDNRALIYVYRKNKLSQMLENSLVAEFLKGYGYTISKLENIIARLKHRIAESLDFPHEIGVFLGYPIGDVIGFIENSGRNCKCFGCWKVYCNECEARQTFEKYKKCTNIYRSLYDNGTPVSKLTVAI